MGSRLRLAVGILLFANVAVWVANGYYTRILAESPAGLRAAVQPKQDVAPVRELRNENARRDNIADHQPPESVAEGKWGRAISSWFAKSVCKELGPFDQRVLASRVMSGLQNAGAEVVLLDRPVDIPKGYWVLAAVPNAATGKLLGAELDKISMRDWQVVKSSPLGMALSMGLFNTKASARLRLNQVKAAVPDAVLHVKTRAKPQFWIQADAPEKVLQTEYENVKTVQNCSSS